MTQDEMEKEILALRAEINSMKASYSFPKTISDAIRKRIGLGLVSSGTGSVNAATVYGSFPVTVPAAASSTLVVTVDGTTYELLVK